MRKYAVLLAVGVASVAVWAASASAISGPQTFSLLEVSRQQRPAARGLLHSIVAPVGGDRIAFTNKLYKWAGTKKGVGPAMTR